MTGDSDRFAGFSGHAGAGRGLRMKIVLCKYKTQNCLRRVWFARGGCASPRGFACRQIRSGIRVPLASKLSLASQVNFDYDAVPAAGKDTTDSALICKLDYAR